jgi:hypothetical protein
MRIIANDMDVTVKPRVDTSRTTSTEVFHVVPFTYTQFLCTVSRQVSSNDLELPFIKTPALEEVFVFKKISRVPWLYALCVLFLAFCGLTFFYQPLHLVCVSFSNVLARWSSISIESIAHVTFSQVVDMVLDGEICNPVETYVYKKYIQYGLVCIFTIVLVLMLLYPLTLSHIVYKAIHFYCYPKAKLMPTKVARVLGRSISDHSLDFSEAGFTLTLIEEENGVLSPNRLYYWSSPELLNAKGGLAESYTRHGMEGALRTIKNNTDLPPALTTVLFSSLDDVARMYSNVLSRSLN